MKDSICRKCYYGKDLVRCDATHTINEPSSPYGQLTDKTVCIFFMDDAEMEFNILLLAVKKLRHNKEFTAELIALVERYKYETN